jgi:hypothetical protein
MNPGYPIMNRVTEAEQVTRQRIVRYLYIRRLLHECGAVGINFFQISSGGVSVKLSIDVVGGHSFIGGQMTTNCLNAPTGPEYKYICMQLYVIRVIYDGVDSVVSCISVELQNHFKRGRHQSEYRYHYYRSLI